MRRNPAAAGVVLILGGVVAALTGRSQRDLPEVVLVIGVTLLAAWSVERGARFGAGGATVAGLALGLVIAEHVGGYSGYREELAFAGIALGLLFALRVTPEGLRGAALALLVVAVAEAALQRLPASVNAPDVYRAFNEGWGFGLLVVAYGVYVAVARGGAGAGRR